MKGIFGKSSKNPTEVVRNLKEDLTTLEKGGDGKKQERVGVLMFYLLICFSTKFVTFCQLGPRGPLEAADQHEELVVRHRQRPAERHCAGAAQPGDVQHRAHTVAAQKPAQVSREKV